MELDEIIFNESRLVDYLYDKQMSKDAAYHKTLVELLTELKYRRELDSKEAKKWQRKRKYTITFTKSYISKGWGVHTEVTDDCIISTIVQLKEKYDFGIISVKLQDSFHKSKITIKCTKEDKYLILKDFVGILGKLIDNVHI